MNQQTFEKDGMAEIIKSNFPPNSEILSWTSLREAHFINDGF